MPQLVLECVAKLPDHVHDAADVIALTREPWAALKKALEDNGVSFEERSETVYAAPKPVQTGAKRGRKPKGFVQQPLTSQAVAAE